MESREGHQFHVGSFEGPLDLLLFLIKKNEINIYDIPIALITEQYMEYLKAINLPQLEDLTEFYLMAATLLYIKSRMLLPIQDDQLESWEDPRKELIEKLIEHQKYRQLSEVLEKKYDDTEWTIERRKKERYLPFTEAESWEEITVWDLLKSFSGLMKGLTPEAILNLYEEISINEKVALINEYLETRSEIKFLDLITKPNSPMDIICAFLAVLEMVKAKKIIVLQNKLFGDILIRIRTENSEWQNNG